ncbi:unnamed protein product [Parnassius apollo]|uniref:(apollo) hypothetical protein n=1 Tax=Parnassius apollo TaxID=110799 RepID=A0A8S3XT36_PARAO|nr:unnamed protein product [Parnassius apollo]
MFPETPLTFDNPPPPVPPANASVVRPSSIISVAATERSNDDESFRSCINIARSSPLKRDWAQIGRAARVLEASGQKKCKNCEVTEFRLVYNQDRLDCVKHSSVELSKKILEVDEKIAKVMSIMTTILKAKIPANVSSGGDRHKELMEQLKDVLSNEIQSGTDEHSTIYRRNMDMSNLLASLLTPPSGDQKPDVSHPSVL